MFINWKVFKNTPGYLNFRDYHLEKHSWIAALKFSNQVTFDVCNKTILQITLICIAAVFDLDTDLERQIIWTVSLLIKV